MISTRPVTTDLTGAKRKEMSVNSESFSKRGGWDNFDLLFVK